MHSTIKKMNKHVTKLLKDVEEAKDKQEAAQRKVINFSYLNKAKIKYPNL
jgi:hypothetical protein